MAVEVYKVTLVTGTTKTKKGRYTANTSMHVHCCCKAGSV